LKFTSYTCDSFPTTSPGKDPYVLKSNRIYPRHELRTSEGLPSMCREVSGELQRQKFLIPRSVSSYGLRSIDLLREPSRYRGLSSNPEQETLPYGHTGQGVPERSCRGKRNSRLAYVCRLRPLPDRYCLEALPGRTDRSRSGAADVCPGCYDHRSLPIHVSLGQFPATQGCGQTPYADGPAGSYPNLYLHFQKIFTLLMVPQYCRVTPAGFPPLFIVLR